MLTWCMLTKQTDSICTLPELLVACCWMSVGYWKVGQMSVWYWKVGQMSVWYWKCLCDTGRWVKEVVWVADHANRMPRNDLQQLVSFTRIFSSMFVVVFIIIITLIPSWWLQVPLNQKLNILLEWPNCIANYNYNNLSPTNSEILTAKTFKWKKLQLAAQTCLVAAINPG